MPRLAVYAAAALAAGAMSLFAALARPDAGPQTVALDGVSLFTIKGCTACHDRPDSESLTDTGPSLVDARSWAGERVDGLSAEEYLEQSMRNPSAFISPRALGEVSMPLLQLSDDEIEALVDYLLAPLTADAIDYHGRIETDAAELLRRAQDGDADAFSGLVASHRHSALRVATVLLGDGNDADDVVQVATERAWQSITSVDPDRGFRAWFLRIVTNTARNQRRAWWRRRRAELRVAARPLGIIADPLDDTITASEREVVVAALNRLDAMERLMIALRHFEQLTEQEMADVLDCPPGTVKSRLSRAMSKLRTELTMEALGDG